MLGRVACMVGELCVAGGMYGRGMHGNGMCMAGGMCVAGQMATVADVRILLECILVNLLILNSKHTDKRIVYKPFFISIQKGFLCHLVQFTLNWIQTTELFLTCCCEI